MQSEWITYLMSGGLVSLLIGFLTLRSRVRKAEAETELAHLENTEKATRILMENIVEPLKKSLDETRRDLEETKIEMRQLREAIDAAHHCVYRRDCPVLERMQFPKCPTAD